jgi:alpha-beta hydrolase superfamily lysophospholipase
VPGKKTKPRRALAAAAIASLAAFAALNAVAYRHARAMLVFSKSGEKTKPAPSLTRLQKLAVLLEGVNLPHIPDSDDPSSRGLAFRSVRIPYGSSYLDAWEIAARKPRGRVLMFHGYGASKSSLLNAAALLHGLDLDLVLVDFPGYGGSPGTMTTIGYREAEAVRAVYEWSCDRSISGPLILDGVSMGAAAVLRAVGVLGASPDALILESPFDRLSNTTRHRFAAMGLPSFPFVDLLLFWGGQLAGMDAFAHDPAAYARGVRCPTLLMAGDRDRYVLPEETQAVFSALAGPKTLELFPGAGHEDLSKASPRLWRSRAAAFLAPLER